MSDAAVFPLHRVRPTATVPVCVFTTWWSIRGHRIRLALARAAVPHRSVDLAVHPEAAVALPPLPPGAAGRLPIVVVDGEWLTEPTLADLEDALRRHALLEGRPSRSAQG